LIEEFLSERGTLRRAAMSKETRDFGPAERLPEMASAHRARQRYTGACRPISSDLGWSKAVHTRDKPVVLRGNFARGHALFVSVKKKERKKNGSEDPPLQGGDAGSG
jgi:hypothetical protein